MKNTVMAATTAEKSTRPRAMKATKPTVPKSAAKKKLTELSAGS